MQLFLIIGGVLLVLLAGSVTFNKFQYEAIQEAAANLATEKANVSTLESSITDQNNTILRMEFKREQDQEQLTKLGDKLNAAQEQREQEIAKFNNYRDRLDKAAIAHPTRIGRLATRATLRVFDAFFTASGGKKSGGDTEAAPSSADTSLSSGTRNNRDNAGTD